MKLTNAKFFFCVILLILSSQFSFSQNAKPKQNTPVALGKTYQIPEKPDVVIPGTTPTMMRSVLESYILLIEWNLAFRFTDSERKQFEKILINDWNSNEDSRKIFLSYPPYLKSLSNKTGYEISSEWSNRASAEVMDVMNERLGMPVKSLRWNYKKSAAKGDPEAIFVLHKLNEYEKPLARGNNMGEVLSRKHIDATAEWIAYKINVVANKEVFVLDEEKRLQMEKLIINQWNNEVNGSGQNSSSSLGLTLFANVNRWQNLRIKKHFSFDEFKTNYNKLSTMVEWAQDVLYFCPSIKPYAEQRSKEYRDYAAKMNDNEWRVELYRLQLENQVQNIAIENLRRQQLESHVLKMNIAEGMDDRSTTVWKIKDRP